MESGCSRQANGAHWDLNIPRAGLHLPRAASLPACGAAAAHVPSEPRAASGGSYGGNAVIQAVRLVGEIAQADFLTDGQYETLCETMSLEEREDVDALLWQISDLWDQVKDFTGRDRNDLERIRTFLADDLLNT